MVNPGGQKRAGPENDPHHLVLTHHRNRNHTKNKCKHNAQRFQKVVKVASKREQKQAIQALQFSQDTRPDRLLTGAQTIYLLRAPVDAEDLAAISPSGAFVDTISTVPQPFPSEAVKVNTRAAFNSAEETANATALVFVSHADSCVSQWTNLYAQLGLDESRGPLYTAEQIRRAYRTRVCECHPDKAAWSGRTEAELNKQFMAVQRAYKVLGNEKERRKYDSRQRATEQLPSLPTRGSVNDSNFFAVFGPLFERFSRFSERHPCPQLGDLATSEADVNAFYDFWLNFRSWRVFSVDIPDKTHEEKQQKSAKADQKAKVEKEKEAKAAKAEKAAKQAKRAEQQRILQLVDMAKRFDPRVRAQINRAKQERVIVKKQRLAHKRPHEWDQQHQNALETAMRAVRPSASLSTDERWRLIARHMTEAGCPRTDKQCKERFRELRAVAVERAKQTQ